MEGLTTKYADFAVNLSYSELPPKVVAAAKDCVLDCLGCILAGSDEPAGKIIAGYIQDIGGKPQATVITKGFKSSAPLAALANGTMGHALDYDDACVALAWHPTSVLLPAILALGELYHASGKDIINAYVVGLEVAGRLGRAIYPHYLEGGWHNMGTIGSIGAAASASKILGLNIQQTIMALGIASSEASGLRKNFGTMTKPFHAGNAAKNGVTAAMLAKMGFTADDAILEGNLGICKALGGDEKSLAEMSKTLGTSYELTSPGILLKAYASCYATHKCIEATLFLKKKHVISADDIAEVHLETEPFVSEKLRYHKPKTALEGKFSMEYCVAVAILDGEAGSTQFTDERVKDSQVHQLLQKIKYVHTGKGPNKPQIESSEGVTIKLRNGKQYSHKALIVKGHPENPMTKEEIFSKYQQCSSPILSQKQIKQSFELISNLETLKDINNLTDAIMPLANH